MNSEFKDDLRQSVVVMKNEITKFLRGKRILVFAVLFVVFVGMIAGAILAFGDDMLDMFGEKKYYAALFISMTGTSALIAAVLFSATSLVSEFQERTALILFTRPVKKSSIFLGKFLASALVAIVFDLLYYVFAVVFTLAYAGDLPSGIPESFLASVCLILAMTGLSFLISSIMKKGSTASIVTLVIYWMILGTVSVICTAMGIGDAWWNLPDAAGSISDAVMNGADVWDQCGVMLVWCLVTAALSYIIFRKRDF